jgi:hypothetical protein
MKPETKEKLKETALKEGEQLAREELPGLIGRIARGFASGALQRPSGELAAHVAVAPRHRHAR